jgi:hypothetical protein
MNYISLLPFIGTFIINTYFDNNLIENCIKDNNLFGNLTFLGGLGACIASVLYESNESFEIPKLYLKKFVLYCFSDDIVLFFFNKNDEGNIDNNLLNDDLKDEIMDDVNNSYGNNGDDGNNDGDDDNNNNDDNGNNNDDVDNNNNEDDGNNPDDDNYDDDDYYDDDDDDGDGDGYETDENREYFEEGARAMADHPLEEVSTEYLRDWIREIENIVEAMDYNREGEDEPDLRNNYVNRHREIREEINNRVREGHTDGPLETAASIGSPHYSTSDENNSDNENNLDNENNFDNENNLDNENNSNNENDFDLSSINKGKSKENEDETINDTSSSTKKRKFEEDSESSVSEAKKKK